MQSFTQKSICVLLLASAFPAIAIANESSMDVDSAIHINAANKLVREGNFDEAIEEYQQVVPTDQIREELNYNLAVTQYRKGEIESAMSLFSGVAGSSDSVLSAASRYNLGNCFFAKAVQSAESDRPAAIDSLGDAIEHYRGSLRGNPNHVDARANIELAVELRNQLRQQEEQQRKQQGQEQQEEGQEQQGEGQEQQEQGQEQQEEGQEQQGEREGQGQDQQPTSQGSESNENESSQDNQQSMQEDPSNPVQQDSQPQDANQGSDPKANEEQHAESETGQDADPEQDQQASDEKGSEGDSKNPSSAEDQRPEPGRSMRPQSSTEPRDASEDRQSQPSEEANAGEGGDEKDQVIPSGELTAADDQKPQDDPNGTVVISDSSVEDGRMTKEEALKMLQSVRDRDMLRRLRQEQIERSRRVRVDRDW